MAITNSGGVGSTILLRQNGGDTLKSIQEIQTIPNIRLMLPGGDNGIARFKLRSTKHTQLVRAIFSWHSGMDVVQAMFKQHKPLTEAEIEELKQHFFRAEEIPQCEVIPHPDNELITVIYRPQEGTDAD